MNCQECGAEINAGDIFCGECGHKIMMPGNSPTAKEAPPPPAEADKMVSRVVYPWDAIILIAGAFVVVLYGQFLTGVYLKFDFLIVGAIVGLATGLYIHLRKVKLSDRKFHSFCVFFVTAMVSILVTEFLIMLVYAAEVFILDGPMFVFAATAALVAGLLAVAIPRIMGKRIA